MAIVINGSGTITGLSVGGLPDGTVDSDTLAANAVVTGKIADGSIVNADVNASAAIANSKLVGAGGVDSADHWYFVIPTTDQDSNAVLDFGTQISKGSNITESGGRMTCATAGIYLLTMTLNNASDYDDTTSVYFRKNGTRCGGEIYWEGPTAGQDYSSESATILVSLAANDIVDCYGQGRWSGNTNNESLTWFAGIRLGG